jgi:hypothetical protein
MTMRLGVSTVKEPGAFIALLRDTGNNRLDLFRRHQNALVPLVPWFPRLAPPDRAFFGRAFTLGPSLDGGFDEFLDDFANASFSAASSACNFAIIGPARVAVAARRISSSRGLYLLPLIIQ